MAKQADIGDYFGVDRELCLTTIAQNIRACNSCNFKHKRVKTYGRGKLDAKLFLVGQNPWFKQEWITLEQSDIEEEIAKKYGAVTSFGDRSGEILTKILNAVGLTDDDIFVTNIVRSNVPGNTVPSLDVVKRCAHFVVEEIATIKPKVILAACDAARQFFKVSSGSVNWFNDITVLGIFHPGVVMHNPTMFNTCVKQMTLAKELSEK